MHIYRQNPWEALVKDCCIHSKQVALIKQIKIFTSRSKEQDLLHFDILHLGPKWELVEVQIARCIE